MPRERLDCPIGRTIDFVVWSFELPAKERRLVWILEGGPADGGREVGAMRYGGREGMRGELRRVEDSGEKNSGRGKKLKGMSR